MTDDARLKHLRMASNTVLATALIVPIAAGLKGFISPYTGGQLAGQAVIAVAVGLAAIAAIFRQAPAWQVHIRLVFALIVLLFCGLLTLRHGAMTKEKIVDTAFEELLAAAMHLDKTAQQPVAATTAPPARRAPIAPGKTAAEKTVAFMKMTAQMQAELADKSAMLKNQFAVLDFSNSFTPASLTNTVMLDRSRDLVHRYELAIKERRELHDDYLANAERFFKTADVSEAERIEALGGFLEAKAKGNRKFDALEKAQLDTVDIFTRMLDFASARVGSMKVRNDTLLFARQADVDGYNALMKECDRVAAAEEKAVQAIKDGEQPLK